MKRQCYGIVLSIALLGGCSQPHAETQSGGGGGTIKAINHTKWAINNFSVNGQSGIDAIGPFDGGGGGCCYGVPAVWKPGMTVKIDWETGLGGTEGFPGYEQWEKYLKWQRKMDMQKKHIVQLSHYQTTPGKKPAALPFIFYPAMK